MLFSIPAPSAVTSAYLSSLRALISSRPRRFHSLLDYPPLIGYQVLVTLRKWLLYLARSSGRRSASGLPSVPLLADERILCVWNS